MTIYTLSEKRALIRSIAPDVPGFVDEHGLELNNLPRDEAEVDRLWDALGIACDRQLARIAEDDARLAWVLDELNAETDRLCAEHDLDMDDDDHPEPAPIRPSRGRQRRPALN